MVILNWMENFTNSVTNMLFKYDKKKEDNVEQHACGGVEYVLTSIFPNEEVKKEVEKYL